MNNMTQQPQKMPEQATLKMNLHRLKHILGQLSDEALDAPAEVTLPFAGVQGVLRCLGRCKFDDVVQDVFDIQNQVNSQIAEANKSPEDKPQVLDPVRVPATAS
ncbi:MAG: hypothetical protein WBJ45_07985 [Limnohabitans sp.]|uniref:hypothetical protein n=1 Tax=Limnohabitans sp. TaxID=1907725 RepID=UPI003BB0A934